MKVIAIIPALNAAKTIKFVSEIAYKYVNEVLVIDDGSIDNTLSELSKLDVSILQNGVNMGYSFTIKKGLRYAILRGYDFAITLDADGEHFPDDIPRFLRMLKDGSYSLLVGNRFWKNNIDEPRKNLALAVSQIFRNLTSLSITDPLCGFRAFHIPSVCNLNLTGNGFGTCMEMLIKASGNLKIAEVPIDTFFEYDKNNGNVKKSELIDNLEVLYNQYPLKLHKIGNFLEHQNWPASHFLLDFDPVKIRVKETNVELFNLRIEAFDKAV